MRSLAAFAVFLLAAACQAPPPEIVEADGAEIQAYALPQMTEAERAQLEAEVLRWADAWMDVWRENDCELSRPLIHPTRSVFVFQGKPTGNIDDWMDYCVRNIENRASWSGSWVDIEVRVFSEKAAEFIGTYSATITYQDGTPARHYPINAQITNLERTATGWGMTHFWYQTGPSELSEEG